MSIGTRIQKLEAIICPKAKPGPAFVVIRPGDDKQAKVEAAQGSSNFPLFIMDLSGGK